MQLQHANHSSSAIKREAPLSVAAVPAPCDDQPASRGCTQLHNRQTWVLSVTLCTTSLSLPHVSLERGCLKYALRRWHVCSRASCTRES